MAGPDIYDDAADAEDDRAQQIQLLNALGAANRSLRRDECSAWCISGTTGKVYTWGDGKTWVLWIGCRSARAWSAAKAALSFCTLTQDCDEEGCLRLHALPTPEQAVTIRRLLGIPKRREYSAEVLEQMKARLAPWVPEKPAEEGRLQPQDWLEAPAGTSPYPPTSNRKKPASANS